MSLKEKFEELFQWLGMWFLPAEAWFQVLCWFDLNLESPDCLVASNWFASKKCFPRHLPWSVGPALPGVSKSNKLSLFCRVISTTLKNWNLLAISFELDWELHLLLNWVGCQLVHGLHRKRIFHFLIAYFFFNFFLKLLQNFRIPFYNQMLYSSAIITKLSTRSVLIQFSAYSMV